MNLKQNDLEYLCNPQYSGFFLGYNIFSFRKIRAILILKQILQVSRISKNIFVNNIFRKGSRGETDKKERRGGK